MYTQSHTQQYMSVISYRLKLIIFLCYNHKWVQKWVFGHMRPVKLRINLCTMQSLFQSIILWQFIIRPCEKKNKHTYYFKYNDFLFHKRFILYNPHTVQGLSSQYLQSQMMRSTYKNTVVNQIQHWMKQPHITYILNTELFNKNHFI